MDEKDRPSIDAVWLLLQDQQKEIAELRRQNERLQALERTLHDGATARPNAARGILSRAGLLKTATAGAAATLGAGVLMQARTLPAGATTGNPIIAGSQTTAENPTSLYYDTGATTGVMFLVSDTTNTGATSTYPSAIGGWTAGNSGIPNGVYGLSEVAGGIGTIGYNNEQSVLNNIGVYGRVDNAGVASAGVWGESTSTSPNVNTSGVYGLSHGTNGGNGNGVYGYHIGGGRGVYGVSVSGHGVYGQATASGRAGTVGQAMGSGAFGILGFVNPSSGSAPGALAGAFFGAVSVTGQLTANNNYGNANGSNPSGHGVLGISNTAGYGGLSGSTTVPGGAGLIGSDNGVPGAYGGIIYGAFVVTGPKSAAVKHPDGSRRLVYCVEAPESYLEDVGEASLRNGHAVVHLRKDFAALVETGHYYVFITEADALSEGLVVSERHADRFVVQERKGGKSASSFQYRIMAKRADVVAERLPRFTLPERDLVAEGRLPEALATPEKLRDIEPPRG